MFCLVRFWIVFSVCFFSLWATAEEEKNHSVDIEITEPAVTESIAVSVDQEKINALVKGNNLFALHLYARLKSTEGNLLFSPYSISSALAMTYAGSAGNTELQMKKALNFSLQKPELDAAFSWLNDTLTHYTSDFGPNFRLMIANSIWLQSGLTVLPDFQKRMTDYYRASMRQVDFLSHGEVARNSINHWVADHTNGRITNLLQPTDISRATRLVLASAFYMKAKWTQIFDVERTQNAPFFPSPAHTISVPMMQTTASFPLYQEESLQLLELPYASPKPDSLQLAMLILLPAKGTELGDIEKVLSADQLRIWHSQMAMQRVNVTLPKFKSTGAFSLNDALQAMGMKDAFSNRADFSKMSSDEDLHIGQVVHKAYINVDEYGTEAAAASAVTMNLTGVHSQPVMFRADRPFVYVIIEKSTGSILLIGRLVMP